MRNVEMQRDGNTLILKVDLAKTFGPSKSMKTTIIGTTGGNQEIAAGTGIFCGVTVYSKIK